MKIKNLTWLGSDMFDNDTNSSVPIAGLYNLDANDVSTDITQSMMRYMLSAERQKQLIEIISFCKIMCRILLVKMKSVIKDPNKIDRG